RRRLADRHYRWRRVRGARIARRASGPPPGRSGPSRRRPRARAARPRDDRRERRVGAGPRARLPGERRRGRGRGGDSSGGKCVPPGARRQGAGLRGHRGRGLRTAPDRATAPPLPSRAPRVPARLSADADRAGRRRPSNRATPGCERKAAGTAPHRLRPLPLSRACGPRARRLTLEAMERERLAELLEAVRRGACPVDEALDRLRALPYEDLGFARLDHHRSLRNGFPEVVFGEGKTTDQIVAIAGRLAAAGGNVLITRLAAGPAEHLLAAVDGFEY